MQRVVSGEDIHGLPTKYSSSDLQQLLQHQPLETSATITQTTSLEPFGTNTNTNTNNVTSSISDDAMSLEPFVIVVGAEEAEAEAANVVENYSGDVNDNTCSSDNDVMMDVANNNTSSSSTTESSAERDQQQQQQLHPRFSVLSPLLPTGAGHSSNIPRIDSRNSATTFSSQGRQGSQNSSRDWGWFEDMHHSDQGGMNVVSSGGTTGAGAVVQQQQQQQQQQRNIKNNNNINSMVISGTTSSSDSNINNSNNNNGRKKYERMTRTARNNNNNDMNENNNNNNNNKNNRPSIIDTATTIRASLLPTGNEMIVDDMQEYLEPILIHPRSRDMENEAAVQAVTAPNYVLEESLSDQFLWKNTAGNRPPQPVEERAFFEAMWAENFSRSEVAYQMPKEVLTATTPVSLNPFADGNFGSTGATSGTGNSNYNLVNITASAADTGVGGSGKQDVAEEALVSRLNDPSRGGIHSFVVPGMSGSGSVRGQPPHLQNNQHRVVKSTSGSSGDLTVFTKGDNVFGTTVSKSFARPSVNGDLVTAVDTVNISVASYRVVESEKRGKHAQFLVIYREGSIRDTIGVWKRYSDFQELSNKVTKVHEGCTAVIANMSPLAVTEEHDVEHLPNAITSWHLLKKRKRWYRCLDPGYLSLKVFLLERFLHDILFESSSPDLLRDFVGVPPPK